MDYDAATMSGEVMETIYYETNEEFNKEIEDSYEIGRLINHKVLSNDILLVKDIEDDE